MGTQSHLKPSFDSKVRSGFLGLLGLFLKILALGFALSILLLIIIWYFHVPLDPNGPSIPDPSLQPARHFPRYHELALDQKVDLIYRLVARIETAERDLREIRSALLELENQGAFRDGPVSPNGRESRRYHWWSSHKDYGISGISLNVTLFKVDLPRMLNRARAPDGSYQLTAAEKEDVDAAARRLAGILGGSVDEVVDPDWKPDRADAPESMLVLLRSVHEAATEKPEP